MINADIARCLKYDGFNLNRLEFVLDDLCKKVKEVAWKGENSVTGVYTISGSIEENDKLLAYLEQTLTKREYTVGTFSYVNLHSATDMQLIISISW